MNRCALVSRGTIRRVRRRLFNLAAAVSLVLCVAVGALWFDAGRAVKGVEVRTSVGGYWQFFSTKDGLGLLRVKRWPESAGVVGIGYNFSEGLTTGSLPVFSWGSMGGARARVERIAFVELARGGVCVVIGPDGKILRVPPAPPSFGASMLSSRMPYWKVVVPHAVLHRGVQRAAVDCRRASCTRLASVESEALGPLPDLRLRPPRHA